MIMLLGEERTVRCCGKDRDPVEGSHVGVCGRHLNGHIQDSEASIWTGPSVGDQGGLGSGVGEHTAGNQQVG
jgi:hypothetical protein